VTKKNRARNKYISIQFNTQHCSPLQITHELKRILQRNAHIFQMRSLRFSLAWCSFIADKIYCCKVNHTSQSKDYFHLFVKHPPHWKMFRIKYVEINEFDRWEMHIILWLENMKGRDHLVKSRHRWEDNIRMDLRRIEPWQLSRHRVGLQAGGLGF
jgi:hypothetical protein